MYSKLLYRILANEPSCPLIARVSPRRYYSKRVNKLRNSDEALRQLTMGCGLDPQNPTAAPVPILEEIFDDANIYDRPDASNGTSAFVTPDSEWAPNPSQIKGCNALLVAPLFSQRLLRLCGTKQDFGSTASVYYFPPWHPIAQGRKSRPALLALRGPGEQYNGNKAAQMPESKLKSRKSMNPFDYAVWRLKATRMYRRALWETCEIDGLYVVTMRQIPTIDEARRIMTQFANHVRKADLKWADKQKSILNVNKINYLLERAHYPPLSSYVSQSAWNVGRPK